MHNFGETRKSTRIIGYDFARALAIVGMIIVNFKVVMGATENGPSWLIAITNAFDGRAAATFVVLAGIGISLMNKKAIDRHDVPALRANQVILLKRSIFLFVVGLIYYFIWPADILHFYGVYICLGILLLGLPTVYYWISAAVAVCGSLVLHILLNYEAGWDFVTLDYTGFWTIGGFLKNLFFNGFHPVLPWIAFLFIGMWVGTKDVRSEDVRRRLLRFSLSVAILAEVVSWLIIRALSGSMGAESDLVALFGTHPMPPMPLYIVAGSATAITIILLCVELTERYGDRVWILPIVHTGQLALTIYIAHVVIGMGALESWGMLEDRSLAFSMGYSLLFMAISIVCSHVWRTKAKRGPIEWVMRKISG